MSRSDLGLYLMTWLFVSALMWLMDLGHHDFTVKEKVLFPILVTVLIFLFRIAIWLMMGE